MENKKEGNKKKKHLLLLLLLLIVALGTYFFFRQSPESLGFDSSAKKYDSKIKKPEEWSQSRIAFPAFKEMSIEEGTDKLYIALANPSFNEANLQFSLRIEPEKSPFFETKLVKPGEAITEVPIPKLAAGEYKVQLKMNAYAPNDDSVRLNGTETFFSLTVLKK